MVKKKTDKGKRWVKKRGNKLEKLTSFLNLILFESDLENLEKLNIHQPGFEPGFERWQRPVMTATLLMSYDGAQTRIRTGDNCLFRAALSH